MGLKTDFLRIGGFVQTNKILAKELELSKGRKVTDAINAKLAKSIKGAAIKRSPYKSWGIVK